jgi:hypothetical protein
MHRAMLAKLDRDGRTARKLSFTTDCLWPIGEVHDRPLIQCTTGSSATSGEELKREAN